MPQQRIDDFEPDDFELDDFESDDGISGSWLSRIWKSPAQEAREKGLTYKPDRNRPDTNMYGVSEDFWNTIGNNVSDIIGGSKYIPDWMKRPLGTVANWNFVQLPRIAADWFSAPENVATPALLRPGKFKLPETQFPIPEPQSPKLLSAGRGDVRGVGLGDRYIGGTAGVQKESLLTPQEEARLQGYEFTIDENGDIVFNKSGQPSGSALDTDAKQEADRLAREFYTGNEQAGGSFLEVPDNPRYLRGTELGMRPSSLAGTPLSPEPLQYPLNVVPEAVRPRSEQAVQQALSGEPKPRMTEAERFTFENEPKPPEPPIPPAREGTKINQDILLPSTTREVRQARTNTRLNIDENTVANAPPEIQPAIETMIKTESKLPSPWKAVYTQLEKLSPTLAVKAKRAVQRTRQYDASWIPEFEAAIRKLSKQERSNFGAYVEGTLPISSPRLQMAVDAWRRVESSIGDKATNVRLRLFTDSKKWVPFQKNTDNYWPHIPSEKDPVGIVDRLVASGMSRSEAKRVEAFYRKSGELIVPAQWARAAKSTVPYKLEADAGLQHIRSMSKRIAQHEEFGPMDVKGFGPEGIAGLIENTRDPKLTSKLMERIIGRDERANEKLTMWLDRARKYSAVAHLQNFTIPNVILGTGSTAQRAARYPIASLTEVAKLFSKRYRTEMGRSGVWQNFNHTLVEEMSKFDPYLVGAGETFNRGIAGAVGKAVAKQALKELKKNPESKIAAKELSELVLEPLANLLTQEELNPQQLSMAAGRMAEVTQGLNVPGNLPLWASDPVTGPMTFGAQLMLQFKKMGYQATKNVWDTVDPRKVGALASARNVATWAVISQIVGELTGDTKAWYKSWWSGQDEVGQRGSQWLQGNGISPAMIEGVANGTGFTPEQVARVVDNATQSFFLGLPADLLMSSTYGPQGLLSALAGPIPSDAAKLFYYTLTGNTKQLGKEAVKAAPVPGSTALANTVFDDVY
jgi:hypothetical protein